MHGRWRRGLSFLVSASMVFGLVPAPALAEMVEEVPTGPEAVVVEESSEEVQQTDGEDNSAGAIEVQGEDDPEYPALELGQEMGISTESGGCWVGTYTAPSDGYYSFVYTGSGAVIDIYDNEEMSSPVAQGTYEGQEADVAKAWYLVSTGAQVWMQVQGDQMQDISGSVVVEDETICLNHATIELVSAELELADGMPAAPDVTVTNPLGAVLGSNDYELRYYDSGDVYLGTDAPTAAGDYYVAAAGCDGSVYTSETEHAPFTVTDPNGSGGQNDEYDLSLGYLSLAGLGFDVSQIPLQEESYQIFSGYNYEVSRDECDLVYYDSEEGGQPLEDAPTEPGTYWVAARAKAESDYQGETRRSPLRVYADNDLSNETYFYGALECDYFLLGSTVELVPSIYRRGEDGEEDTQLVYGTDFVLDHFEDDQGETIVDDEGQTQLEPPSAMGDYSVYYRGDGTYTGHYKMYFSVGDGKDLIHATISFVDDCSTFTEGEEYESRIVVTDAAGQVLDPDVDYTLSYSTEYGETLETAPSAGGNYYIVAVARENSPNGYRQWTGPYQFSIRQAIEADVLTLGETIDVTLTECESETPDYRCWMGEFTAEESGRYIFHAQSELGSFVRLWNTRWDDGGELAGEWGTDVSHVWSLEAGQTVYLVLDDWSQTEDYQATVSVTQANVHDLSLATLSMNPISFDVNEHNLETSIPGAVSVTDVAGNLVGTDCYELVYYQWKWVEEYLEDRCVALDGVPSEVGDYYVAARAITNEEGEYSGDYTGETDKASFYIADPADLGGGYWSNGFEAEDGCVYTDMSFDYTESTIAIPSVKVWHDETVLNEGESGDYALESITYRGSEVDEIRDRGRYTLHYGAVAGSGYTGTFTLTIDVCGDDYYDLSYGWLSLTRKGFSPSEVSYLVDYECCDAYTWNDHWVSSYEYELVYYASDSANEPLVETPTDPGTYWVAARAWEWSDYKNETPRVKFEVYGQNSIANTDEWKAAWSGGGNIAYTGEQIVLPVPHIYRYGEEYDEDGNYAGLIVGTDFEFDHYEDGDYTEIPAPREVGGYYAVYKGKSPYTGTRRLWFEIYDPYDIDSSQWDAGFTPSSVLTIADGEVDLDSLTPFINRYDESLGQTVDLELGTDFELDHYENGDGEEVTAPSETGTYYAVYHGIDPYAGTRRIWFEIADPNDIGSNYWNAGIVDHDDAYAYTGDAIVPNARLWIYDEATGENVYLTEGTDYEVAYYKSAYEDETFDEAPSEIGDYEVILRGKDPYTGTRAVGFWIVDASDLSEGSLQLDNYTVADLNDLRPTVRNKANEVLVLGTDYELVYYDEENADDDATIDAPTEPGTYWVAARGKVDGESGYRGQTYRCEFELVASPYEFVELLCGEENDRDIVFTEDDEYSWYGKFTAPATGAYEFFTVSEFYTSGTLYGDMLMNNYLANGGSDSRIAYYLNEGETAYLKLEGYGGDQAQATICVREANVRDLSLGYIRLEEEDQYNIPYTGEAMEPKVTAFDVAGNKLIAGTDYSVVYYAWDNVANEYVVLEGAPKDGGDYCVAAHGTGTQESGYFGDTQREYFSIRDEWSIASNCSVNMLDSEYDYWSVAAGGIPAIIYRGSVIEPVLSVNSWDGDELVEGVDFTVTYANNDAPSAGDAYATATVEGKGNYRGAQVIKFAIVAPNDLEAYVMAEGAKLTANGVEREIDAGILQDPHTWVWPSFLVTGESIKPTVTMLENSSVNVPVEGTDYTVTYEDMAGEECEPTDIGWYYAVVTAVEGGDFVGQARIRYQISSHAYLDSRNTYPQLNSTDQWESHQESDYSWIVTVFDALADLGDLLWSLIFGGNPLTEGTDYTVHHSVYDDVDTYDFEGINDYYGTVHVQVRRGEKPLAGYLDDAEVSPIPSVTYDGTEKRPEVSVTLDGKTLIEGTDYTVAYEDNVNAGTATMRLTGMGDYGGEKEVPFTIAPAAITEDDVTGIAVSTGYTGSEITFPVTVTVNGRQLVENEDYTVTYRNNKNAGTATVVIAGMGNYTGVSIPFTISPVAIDSDAVVVSGITNKAFTGVPIEQDDLTLTLGDYELVEGTDYTVIYTNNTNKGTATVTITAAGTNFTSLRVEHFEIGGQSLAGATIAVIEPQAFTGFAIEPTPTVTLGDTELEAGTDFGYAYEDNVNAGLASIKVEGKGNYAESANTTFTITKADMENVTISGLADVTYTGSDITPEPTVKLGDYTLTSDDYAVSYADNVDAGEASVTVTAKEGGNFSGEKSAAFTIAAATITGIDAIADQTFTGKGIEPELTVRAGNLTLDADDYDADFTENTNAGIATVTVTGKGNYEGETTMTFTIVKANIADATVTGIEDATYTGTPIEQDDLTLAFGDYALTKGTDFLATYEDNTNAGQATITIAGLGNFEGTRTEHFAINQAFIAADDVTGIAESADFTGFAITMPVEVTAGGKTLEPVSPADPTQGDYTVSYADNTNAGTATVTVEGRNSYAGTVTKTFAINRVAIDSDAVTLSGVEDKEFTGSEITQDDLTLTLGNYTLVEGTDYTVSYENNTSKGEATVTVTAVGDGNFTGSLSTKFNITGKVLRADEVTIGEIASYTYDGTAKEPTPTVMLGTTELRAGTDFEFSYENNVNAGTATVNVNGKGDFGGTVSTTFAINPAPITSIDAIEDQPYIGAAIEPELTVKAGEAELTEGAHYIAAYANNTEVGTATVTVVGVGNYAGTQVLEFAISAAAIDSVEILGEHTFTGSAIKPELTVRAGDLTLNKSDYTAVFSNNTNAGDATVTVTAIDGSNFTGAEDATFTIAPREIRHATVDAFANQTYTGSPIEPALTLFDGGRTLVKDTDYEVAYADNTNVGTATVTITGKGNYTGTKPAGFAIAPMSIARATVTADAQTYTGQKLTSEITVSLGGANLSANDYDVAYTDNVNVGTATVTVTGKGNYAETAKGTFQIRPASIAEATISQIGAQAFTGKAIEPEVTVTLDGEVLDAKSYKVSYANNVKAGQATVTVTGTGNYANSATDSFTINKIALDDENVTVSGIVDKTAGASMEQDALALKLGDYTLIKDTDYTVECAGNSEVGTVTITAKEGGNFSGTRTESFYVTKLTLGGVADATYTGKAITPEPSVKDGDTELVKGADFEYQYDNNTNAGTAVVSVVGKGTYAGVEMSAQFTINPAALPAVTLAQSSFAYDGTEHKPEVTVKVGETTLTKGTDYTVEYRNNVNAGTASAVVTGKGNYAGSKGATFTIEARSIAEATIAGVSAQTFTGKALTPEPTVTLGDQTLVAGTDYTVSYKDNVNGGTATITVKGAGNYTGEATATFAIGAKSLKDAQISAIADQVYTGEAIEPEISVVLDGKKLVQGADYTVQYQENTDAGEATVTVKGTGNYSESTSRTFTIKALDLADATISGLDSYDAEGRANFTYTGAAYEPEVTVSLGGKTLTQDTDYEVDYADNFNAGTATVTINALGANANYTGGTTASFTIAPATITSAEIEGGTTDFTYTGEAIAPVLSVKAGTLMLNPEDYAAAYLNNVNAGGATATVTGKGNYAGTANVNFTIGAASAEGLFIDAIADQTYTGVVVEPKPTVKFGDATLVAGTDYTIAYDNNENVGIATATITLMGNYTGERTVMFNIVPAAVTSVSGMSQAVEYMGAPIVFENLTVQAGDLTLGENDYTATYTNNVNAGRAKLTLAAKGNFTGGGSFEFQITPKSIATGYTVELPKNADGTDIIYTETANLDAFEPMPIVKDANDKVLDPTNYDVTYLNNSVAGEATVVVTGKGNYKDSPANATFTIYKYAGSVASDGTNSVIWHVEESGAMTIEPKKKGDGTVTLNSASALTWSQAVAEYTESVTIDNNVVGCTDASGMFSGLTNVTSVDISQFDTAQVTNMSGMFQGCENLTNGGIQLNNGTLDTSNVTNMSNMFAGCTSLGDNPLANADTSNVTNMSGMFAGCTSLGSLSLGTQSVQPQGILHTMSDLILGTQATVGFDTSSVTNMSEMFKGCTSLTDLDISSFNTQNVADMSYMFAGCTSLKTLNISGFNTKSVTSMAGMYDGCTLNEYTIGNAYASTDNGITEELPEPSASTRMWWATTAQQWRSNAGIIRLDANAADTYCSRGKIASDSTVIESADIKAEGDSYTYDGTEHKPTITAVTVGTGDDAVPLTEGIDYEVTYANATNAGTAKLTVSGKGDYEGAKDKSYTIGQKSIEDGTVSVAEIADVAYNGAAHKPEPVVTDEATGQTLAKGTDYTLSWADATNVGTATVTVQGTGNYKGSRTTTFSITRAEISVPTGASLPYNGKAQTGVASGAGYTLSGTTSATNVGNYTAKATPDGNHCWKGGATDTKDVTWSIIQADLAAATVSAANQTYTGQALTPEPTVTLGGKTLAKGTDYTVAYASNTNAGTATITVTGKGNYRGTATGKFTIVPADLAGATVSAANQTYIGEALTPEPTVTLGGKTLVKGTDYTVAYKDNVNAGTATVTVTGKGNYKGTKSGSFTIAKAASSISIAAQKKTYTGKAIKYSGKVTKSGSTGAVTYAYYSDKACTKVVKAASVKNAGTYWVKATLAADANYNAATSAAAKLTVAKAKQPMKLKAVTRTASLKKLKTKAVTVAAPLKFTKKAKGQVTYAKVAKGSSKLLTVNKKTGKVTVKKGTKKGTYKVKIKVTAKGNKNYKAGSKTITCKVVVK